MRILSSLQDPAQLQADWFAVGVFEGQDEPPAPILADWIGRLRASKDLNGNVGETVALFGAGPGGCSALAFGLGKRAAFDPGTAFAAGSAVARRLAGQPRGSVAVLLPAAGEPSRIARALVEGLIVGTLGPGLRKSEPGRHEFGELRLVAMPGGPIQAEALEAAVRRGEIVGRAVNRARELVNTPPSEKPPTALADRIRALAEGSGVVAEVWDRDRIARERFGGLLGVAAGSSEPPAFVRLEYRNGGDAPATALVGKGVTFDSGGLSIKPSASMEDMKSDMTGAAVVAATIMAVAQLGLRVNLRGYLALAENMTGGSALKLGDVLTIRNGKTVEVLNTDAEGRLILADALSFAAEERPGRMIDLATLTGACMVALGTRIAGLFSNDDALAAALQAAGRRTGERTWRLPLDDDFDELLKSSVADCKNVGGKWGGAVTAARFLQKFVGATPWAHLDIAGPSWADAESATRDAGGTGCFVRTLVNFLDDPAQADGP